MSRLGVPIVDATEIVDGEAWASKVSDGRHYHPIVPMEVCSRFQLLTFVFGSGGDAATRASPLSMLCICSE